MPADVRLTDAAGTTIAAVNSAGAQAMYNAPLPANINDGFLSHTATTAAATLLTVAAGKTWVGEIGLSVSGSKQGATTGNGVARGVIASAGTGAAPAAGTIMAVEAKVGANVAAGTVGTNNANANRMRAVVAAPAGNAVTLTLASTITNLTDGVVDAYAIGESL